MIKVLGEEYNTLGEVARFYRLSLAKVQSFKSLAHLEKFLLSKGFGEIIILGERYKSFYDFCKQNNISYLTAKAIVGNRLKDITEQELLYLKYMLGESTNETLAQL